MAKVIQHKRMPLVRQSAQQVWLAGLGALALAEEEGGKLFGSLVKKGHTVDKANRHKVEKALARVNKIRENARRTVGRFRLPVDTGMAGALHRFGIPSRQEIVTLTKRVEELTRSVERAKAKPRKRAPAKHVVAAAAV